MYPRNELDLAAIVKETQQRVSAVRVRLKDPLCDVSMAAPGQGVGGGVGWGGVQLREAS